jgi:excinuclease ABC subunit C
MTIVNKSYSNIIWTENNIKNVPEKPGVYVLMNKDKRFFYIGYSKDRLSSRLFDHFRMFDDKTRRFITKIRWFRWFQCDTAESAAILEKDMIKRLKPIYNEKVN